MTNIVIESTPTRIDLYLNSYSSLLGMQEEIIPKTSISKLSKTLDGMSYLVAKAGTTYLFSVDGADGSLIVDSVNSAFPSDNDDLFSMIEAII